MHIESVQGVLQDNDGAPLSFHYAGKSYLVCSRPVRWYSRKLWWETEWSAEKGAGASILETEMWRLWASCGDTRVFFELSHSLPQDIWVVAEVR